jgi:SSS family transporter
MLAFSVVVYLLITIVIGYLASRRVHNAADFAVAGRRLPLFMSSAALFATWFGSETVLGASGEFIEHGLVGVIEEPIGAALCLILVGVFYGRKIYRSDQLTFSDLFKQRFGKRAELISAIVMIPSFFSWIAAQFLALGLILELIFGIDLNMAIVISAFLVMFYTTLGGMWAVSITDTMQTVVIVSGLAVVLVMMYLQLDGKDGLEPVPEGHFSLVNFEKMSVWEWFGAWITVGLGSIASQDIYQRVISAKSEKVAVSASIISGVMYLVIGFIPLLIGLFGSLLYPELYVQHKENFISALILYKTPEWIRILFFGALVSAILSTASGALLAPATVLAENILKPRLSNYSLLKMMRWSVVFMALASLVLAFNNQSIFELVGLASSFGLVSLFLPFTFTLFVPATNEHAVLFGMVAGLVFWGAAESISTEIPGIFYGLAGSLLGILSGIFFFKRTGTA